MLQWKNVWMKKKKEKDLENSIQNLEAKSSDWTWKKRKLGQAGASCD